MRKNAAILLIACGMFAGMLPAATQAASSAHNQAVAQNLAASLRSNLQEADQQPELSSLVNSTYVLLDALENALGKNDAVAMSVAVEQYAEEVQLFQTEAIDAACAVPLTYSVVSQLSAMIQTVAGGGTPVCLFISVSNNIADILSASVTYQICVLDKSENPDSATRNNFVQTQLGLKIYKFSASVASVALCIQSFGVQEVSSLILQFIALFIPG